MENILEEVGYPPGVEEEEAQDGEGEYRDRRHPGAGRPLFSTTKGEYRVRRPSGGRRRKARSQRVMGKYDWSHAQHSGGEGREATSQKDLSVLSSRKRSWTRQRRNSKRAPPGRRQHRQQTDTSVAIQVRVGWFLLPKQKHHSSLYCLFPFLWLRCPEFLNVSAEGSPESWAVCCKCSERVGCDFVVSCG